MYFSVVDSYECYFEEDNINITLKPTLNVDCCIICYESDNIKLLSDFSHIKINCQCNPKLHEICINKWIHNSPTCPICRQHLDITVYISLFKLLYLYKVTIYLGCLLNLCRFICDMVFVNLARILFFNICTFYLMTYREDYDDFERVLDSRP
jgi:hypothetical protein